MKINFNINFHFGNTKLVTNEHASHARLFFDKITTWTMLVIAVICVISNIVDQVAFGITTNQYMSVKSTPVIAVKKVSTGKTI